MKKDELMAASRRVRKIEDLLVKADGLFREIPPAIQAAISGYHGEDYSLPHCLYWGKEVAMEIRGEWRAVVAGIPCEAEPPGQGGRAGKAFRAENDGRE
jgi:hypothetical protein